MTLQVIDISSHQGNKANDIAGAEGVIVKVSQGVSYINEFCDSQYQAAKASGKVLGIYHYISGEGGAKAEAKFFVDNSEGYWKNDEVTVWADWEEGSNSAWGNGSYAADFITEVNRLIGVNCCGIYTGVDGISQTGPLLSSTVPLWFAGYPDLRDSWDVPEFIWSISPWLTLTMWQFTDSNGKLDRNIFYGDRNIWTRLSVKEGYASEPVPEALQPPLPGDLNGKTLEQLADRTISGGFGGGSSREGLLQGFYTSVQAIVNERFGYIDANTCHIILRDEVLAGRLGNGADREFLLGSYYQTVQNLVDNPSEVVATPGTGLDVTVEDGDTLSSIAEQFGVSVDQIININGLSNPDLIYAGQKLRLK